MNFINIQDVISISNDSPVTGVGNDSREATTSNATGNRGAGKRKNPAVSSDGVSAKRFAHSAMNTGAKNQ